MTTIRKAWPLILPCLVLAVLPFLLFWQVWWPDAGVRRVFVLGDFAEQHYPMRSFVAQELRQGRLPLWDPYTLAGEPAAATSIFAAFYPLGLWEAIFPRLPFLALELEAIAHLSLAAVFTFLFVRRVTGHAGAGLLAGAAFGIGGCLTSYPLLQMIIVESAAWLPAGLWLLERGLARRSLIEVGAAGLALGLSILAGHTQTALYVGYTLGAYFLFRAWRLRVGRRFAVLSALALVGAAVGLSAPQWLPTLQLARLTPRAHSDYAFVSPGFQWQELLGLFRPNPGQWSPLYVGLIPLALALVGVGLWRKGESWFWAAVALIALGLSLGHNGPLYPLAYHLAPGFSIFRQQERIALVVTFALAVLAGYGYAALQAQRWWPRAVWVAPLLLALIFADLYRVNHDAILQAPPAGGYYAPTTSLQYLQSNMNSLDRVSSEGLLPADGNAGLYYRLQDICGNGPLVQTGYEQIQSQVPEVRWWQLFDARYVLTHRQIDFPALKLVSEDPSRDERVYAIDLGQQPAWVAHAWRPAVSQQQAVAWTADMALNPLQTAVLEGAPSPQPQPATGAETVRVTQFSPQQETVEANLTAPGVLVLSEVSYPGWNVTVNGRPARALRAFGLLRAVALPAGQAVVEWRFEPIVAWVGLGLAGVTLLAFAGALVRRRPKPCLVAQQ